MAYALAFGTVLLFGTAAAVSKLLLNTLDNLQLLLLTTFFATVVLCGITILQGKLSLLKKFSIRDWLVLGGVGGIGIFLYHICYFGGLQFLPAQEATIINYLWPLTTVIIAIPLLKESLSKQKFAAVLLSLLGVWLVISEGDIFSFQFSSAVGIALSLSAAVLYGLFSVIGKRFKYDTTISMLVYCAASFVLSLIAVLLFSSIPSPTVSDWLGTFWLGGISIGLGFWMWFLALQKGDTAKVSNIAFLAPFLSLVFVYLLLNEQILWSSVAGLVLIVAGIFVQSTRKTA